MLLKNPRFQRFIGGGWLERTGIRLASSLEYMLLRGHKNPAILKSILQTRWKRKTLVTFNESYLVRAMADSVSRLPGEFAEVGVFEGSTARLLCDVKGDKQLHLFDTFEGLPPGTTDIEKIVFEKTKYKTSMAAVQEFLSDAPNVFFYKGLFPQSAEGFDPDMRFAFVHFDVDLYQSTLDCLKFFYPRMNAGGIMLSHDYSVLEGVERAFTEFLADKPERIIELPTTQCMIVKQ